MAKKIPPLYETRGGDQLHAVYSGGAGNEQVAAGKGRVNAIHFHENVQAPVGINTFVFDGAAAGAFTAASGHKLIYKVQVGGQSGAYVDPVVPIDAPFNSGLNIASLSGQAGL